MVTQCPGSNWDLPSARLLPADGSPGPASDTGKLCGLHAAQPGARGVFLTPHTHKHLTPWV